jgi:hypothetical protein
MANRIITLRGAFFLLAEFSLATAFVVAFAAAVKYGL